MPNAPRYGTVAGQEVHLHTRSYLPALMVGQNLQNLAADARSAKTFEDVEAVKNGVSTALDRLDTTTQGGLREILDAIHALSPGTTR